MHSSGENKALHSFCMHDAFNCKKLFRDYFHLVCEAVFRLSNFLQKNCGVGGRGQMLLVVECLKRVPSYYCLGHNLIKYMDQLSYSLNSLPTFTIMYLFLARGSPLLHQQTFFYYIHSPATQQSGKQIMLKECGGGGSVHLTRFLKCFLMSYRTVQSC